MASTLAIAGIYLSCYGHSCAGLHGDRLHDRPMKILKACWGCCLSAAKQPSLWDPLCFPPPAGALPTAAGEHYHEAVGW